MSIPGHGRRLAIVKFPKQKRKTIEQLQLEKLLGLRRELMETENAIAIALSKGARIEPGIHTAELVPERRKSLNGVGGLYMRLVIIIIVFILLPGIGSARDINGDGRIDLDEILQSFLSPVLASAKAQAHSHSSDGQNPRKESKKERKLREKADKQKADEAVWEEETRPPEPAYPGSIGPEFARIAIRAAAVMDNAADSIQKSKFEFAIANQSSIEQAAIVTAVAQNDGERQVASILAAYAQKIPICQDRAWQALQNVLSLAVLSGEVRSCNRELRRLRVQADRTFTRNKS